MKIFKYSIFVFGLICTYPLIIESAVMPPKNVVVCSAELSFDEAKILLLKTTQENIATLKQNPFSEVLEVLKSSTSNTEFQEKLFRSIVPFYGNDTNALICKKCRSVLENIDQRFNKSLNVIEAQTFTRFCQWFNASLTICQSSDFDDLKQKFEEAVKRCTFLFLMNLIDVLYPQS